MRGYFKTISVTQAFGIYKDFQANCNGWPSSMNQAFNSTGSGKSESRNWFIFVKETNVESKFGEKSSSSLFAIKQGNKLCLTALIILSESISLWLIQCVSLLMWFVPWKSNFLNILATFNTWQLRLRCSSSKMNERNR